MVIASISVLSVFLLFLVFGVIAIYASQTETVVSNIKIIYISRQVGGEMRLRAYYKKGTDDSAQWHILTTASMGYPSNSGIVRLEDEATDQNAILDDLVVNLNETNDFVIFECAFRNLGSTAVKLNFDEGLNNSSSEPAPVAINVEQSQLISKTAIDSNFDIINDSPLNYTALTVLGNRDDDNYIEDFIYYYYKIKVSDIALDSHYSTSHVWTFTGYETAESITIDNNGGTGNLDSVTGIRGACPPILKTSNLPTKSNPYNFYGYYSSATNDEQYYRLSGEPTRALPLGTDPLSLYAQYSIEAYVDPTTHEASWPSGLSKSTQVRVIIPSTATSVKSSGFSSCSGLIGVDIPNTIIEIKNYAFQSCTGLTGVVIGKSVTSIGESAFSGCTGLTSITIPNTIEIIGSYAFSDCSNLNYNIDGNLKYLGNDTNPYLVLMGGTSADISTVDINNNTKIIYYRAFYNNTTLTDITIPNSITSIGNYAFYYCTGLTGVTIGENVTSIGSTAFYGCTSMSCDLTSLTLSSVGHNAFNYCTGLTGTVTLTGTIGNNVFYNCTGLTGVTIGENVTSIGSHAFYNCTGLTGVVIGENVTSIGESAFRDCTSMSCDLTSLTLSSVGSYAFYDCTGLTGTVTLTGTIGDSAFRGCTGLTGVVIGENVTSIGTYAFNTCSALTTVKIDSQTIVNNLTSQTSCEHLIENATTIYIKEGLSVGSYITNNFHADTTDKDGYIKYVKNS